MDFGRWWTSGNGRSTSVSCWLVFGYEKLVDLADLFRPRSDSLRVNKLGGDFDLVIELGPRGAPRSTRSTKSA